MATPRKATIAERFTAFDWLKRNFKNVVLMTPEGASKVMKEEIGLNFSVNMIRKTAHDGGLTELWPKKRLSKQRDVNDSWTRDAEIAKAVRFLAEKLGEQLPNIDDINKIVARGKTNNTKPTSPEPKADMIHGGRFA